MQVLTFNQVVSTYPTVQNKTTYRVVGVEDAKVGAKLPGWEDIIAIGHDATTTYSSERSVIRPGYGDVSYVMPSNPSARYWSNSCLIGTLPGYNAQLLSLAQARHSTWVAKKKVSKSEAVAGGIILGELGKTMHQLSHPFNSFMRLTSDYLQQGATIRAKYANLALEKGWKRVPRIAPSVLDRSHINVRALNKSLNDAYLEYTYAIQPTMHDVDSVVQDLTARYLTHEEPFSAYGVADKFAGGVSGDASIGLSSPNWEWMTTYYEVAEVRSFAKIIVDLGKNRSQTLGLWPNQFIPTVWELIPYSFVVDYISNVQEVINGFCYPDPRCRYGYTNTRQRIFGQWAFTGRVRPGESKEGWRMARPPTFFEMTKLTRGSFNWDPPRLILEAPNLKQTINMASLMLARLL